MEFQTDLVEKKQSPNLFAMFTNPIVQFERIRQNPKIWVPLIIISILYFIGSIFLALSMDIEMLMGQGLEEIPADDIDIIVLVTKITIAATGLFTPIFGVLLSSAVQLVIAKIANSPVSFKQLFSMNTFIMIISAAGIILNMGIRYLIGGNPEIYITSLAGLLNQETAGVLSSIEVFALWSLILTAMGLHKTAQLSKGMAWTIAIIFFLIQIGLGLIGTLVQGAPQL